MERICFATLRCSEARKRHSVDCGGRRVNCKMPVRMVSRAMKPELVEPRKADIEAEHEGQHELVGAHGSGDPFGREGFFQQRLEAEFFRAGWRRAASRRRESDFLPRK